MWFYRTITVDLMKPAELVYDGESGVASVSVDKTLNHVNQRITQFYESVTYDVEPKSQLSNGDTITITASYDKELAQRFHLEATQVTKEVVVSNLPDKISSIFQLPYDYQNDLKTRGEEYLLKNQTAILESDFYDVDLTSSVTFEKQEYVCRYFLKAHDSKQHDRILDVYLIYASEKDAEESDVIYYGVTYSGINTAFDANRVNVYGEKLYFGEVQDYKDETNLISLLKRRYHMYDIYELNLGI